MGLLWLAGLWANLSPRSIRCVQSRRAKTDDALVAQLRPFAISLLRFRSGFTSVLVLRLMTCLVMIAHLTTMRRTCRWLLHGWYGYVAVLIKTRIAFITFKKGIKDTILYDEKRLRIGLTVRYLCLTIKGHGRHLRQYSWYCRPENLMPPLLLWFKICPLGNRTGVLDAGINQCY